MNRTFFFHIQFTHDDQGNSSPHTAVQASHWRRQPASAASKWCHCDSWRPPVHAFGLMIIYLKTDPQNNKTEKWSHKKTVLSRSTLFIKCFIMCKIRFVVNLCWFDFRITTTIQSDLFKCSI